MNIRRNNLQLYVVTDRHIKNTARYPDLAHAAEAAAKGGATMIQLRDKELSDAEFIEQARAVHKVTERYGIPLLLNDRVHLVKTCGADGVHLGQEDMSVREARTILGDQAIIGVSAHNVKEAVQAVRDGADYLGCGSCFPTATKKNVTPLARETLRDICRAVSGCVAKPDDRHPQASVPVTAIGGIDADNIRELTGCGVSGVAVVSAVFGQPDIEQACRDLKKRVGRMLADTENFEAVYETVGPVLQGKKGVIFDMDGTLIDSIPMWQGLDRDYMGRYGIVPDMQFHHEVATMTLVQAAEFIRVRFQIPKTAQEIFDDFQVMVEEQYRDHIPLKYLAYELVTWLSRDGYRIAVATANEAHLSEMVLARTKLSEYVETLVSCTMAGAGKDTPAVYELACKNLGIDGSDCVIFEDSLRAIQTAKCAGFATVAVYDAMSEQHWDEICALTDAQIRLELTQDAQPFAAVSKEAIHE